MSLSVHTTNTVCPGCNTRFSLSGLSKHLGQTRNASCIAARDRGDSTGTAEADSGPEPSIPVPDFDGLDLDAPPVPFEGDYFGTYSATDFPDGYEDDPMMNSPDDEPSDSDSSDDEDTAQAPPPHRDDLPHPQHPLPSFAEREAAERSARLKTYVFRFPGGQAGSTIRRPFNTLSPTYHRYHSRLNGDASAVRDGNPYWPFHSKTDWEIGKWAKLRGAGSTSFTELLAIEGVAEKLALSFKNSQELNAIVDKLPPRRPPFQRHEIVVAGEVFEVYFRDVLECIQALFGDPEFAPLLLLVPERHYTDSTKSASVYFDMNTGKWWWATQEALEKERPGATVIPVIISSDKTQLTSFGNKTAYPVYMTLGNLPKDIRCKPSHRGQILLAYLPTSRLQHITVKSSRRRTLGNLFHACMTRVLSPLVSAGIDGVELASGDGLVRRGHPIVATYVGDYPEQLLVMCGKSGECPKCEVRRGDLGSFADTSRPFCNLGQVLDALAAVDEGPLAFTRACTAAGIKAVYHPFWENLPYTDIFAAITPDVLHQLYQGVVKHLIAWLQEAYGADEIDARCARLPPNHSLRHFAKGISHLSRVTGKEHQDMARILMGLIIGLPLPGGASPARLYSTHTSNTLKLLDDALLAFHSNKSIFAELGIRENWRLPKLHSLEHYRHSIELFGTTDNYDTQYSERLHIDFAKDAYRASNHKDELAQMTKWLERKEKVLQHEKYIAWRLSQRHTVTDSHQAPGASPGTHTVQPAALTLKAVSFTDLASKYGAMFFRDALARFVVETKNPLLNAAQVELASGAVFFDFRSVPVFHKAKFIIDDQQGLGTVNFDVKDVAHARPAREDKYNHPVPARFDTVLVRTKAGDDSRITHHSIRGPFPLTLLLILLIGAC
ncbi:hypothetical protein ACG7TL_007345 [Trametes sanguinea]